MSEKNTISQGRFRSKTIAFRMSPEEAELLQRMADASGMTKQDYLIDRALCREVTVIPNKRMQRYMEEGMSFVYKELRRLENGSYIPEELAYRVLFPKRVGGPRDGQYAGLDFGHLVDLAALNHGDRNRREGELRRLQNDAYLGPLVSRYPIGEMPAWVFLELSSFGAFADFYLFCANRWGDSGMRDEHYMLRRANSLRNAAAHSSAIVNGLGSPLGAPQLRYPATLAAALGEIGMSKRLRRSKMRNPRILQMAVLAYAYSRFVPREKAEGTPREATRTCR